MIGNALLNAVDLTQANLRTNLNPEIERALETYNKRSLEETNRLALKEASKEFASSFNPKQPEGLANIILTTAIVLSAGIRTVPKSTVVSGVSKASGVKQGVISNLITRTQKSLRGSKKFLQRIVKSSKGKSNIAKLKKTISKLKKSKKVLVKERNVQVKQATKKAKKLVSGKKIAAERRKVARVEAKIEAAELRNLRKANSPLQIEKNTQKLIKQIFKEVDDKVNFNNKVKRVWRETLKNHLDQQNKIIRTNQIKEKNFVKFMNSQEKALNKMFKSQKFLKLKVALKNKKKALSVAQSRAWRSFARELADIIIKVNKKFNEVKVGVQRHKLRFEKFLKRVAEDVDIRVSSILRRKIKNPFVERVNKFLDKLESLKTKVDRLVSRAQFELQLKKLKVKKGVKGLKEKVKIPVDTRIRVEFAKLQVGKKLDLISKRIKSFKAGRANKKFLKSLKQFDPKVLRKQQAKMAKERVDARNFQTKQLRKIQRNMRVSKTFNEYRVKARVLANAYVDAFKKFTIFYKDLLKNKIVRNNELLRRKIKNLNPLKKSDFDIGIEKSLRSLDKQLKIDKVSLRAEKLRLKAGRKAVKGTKPQVKALDKIKKLENEIRDLELQIAEGRRLENLADALWSEYSKSLKSVKELKTQYKKDVAISNNIKNRMINRIFSGKKKPEKVKKVIKTVPTEKKFNEVLTGESSVTILEVPESIVVNPTPIIDGGSRVPGVNRGGLLKAFIGLRFPNGVSGIGGKPAPIYVRDKPIERFKPIIKPKIDLSKKADSKPTTTPKRKAESRVERKAAQKPKERQVLRSRQITRTKIIVRKKPRRLPKLILLPKLKKKKGLRKVIDKFRAVLPSQFRPTLEAIYFEIIDTKEPEKITGLEVRAIILKLARKKKNGKPIRNKKKLSKKTSRKRKKT